MPRVTGGPKQAQKRKKILKRARGFVGAPGRQYRLAKEFTRRADRYAWIHRRQKKRNFRRLWIVRLSAALRERGIRYSTFIPALTAAGVELNRKMLSDLAITDPPAFDAVVELARPHIHEPAEVVKKAA